MKQYYKLSIKTQKRFQDRLILWQKNRHDPLLRLHGLNGVYAGMYSLDVTGDIRAIYQKIDDEYVMFGFIGTHSQLYK